MRAVGSVDRDDGGAVNGEAAFGDEGDETVGLVGVNIVMAPMVPEPEPGG